MSSQSLPLCVGSSHGDLYSVIFASAELPRFSALLPSAFRSTRRDHTFLPSFPPRVPILPLLFVITGHLIICSLDQKHRITLP